MTTLYNLRKTSNGYLIAKFDPDFNVEAVYELAPNNASLANTVNFSCSCPAGPRPTCKHRKMLPRMLPKADTEFFYCYETQKWSSPLGPQVPQALESAPIEAETLEGLISDQFAQLGKTGLVVQQYDADTGLAKDIPLKDVFELPQYEGVPFREIPSIEINDLPIKTVTDPNSFTITPSSAPTTIGVRRRV